MLEGSLNTVNIIFIYHQQAAARALVHLLFVIFEGIGRDRRTTRLDVDLVWRREGQEVSGYYGRGETSMRRVSVDSL